MTNEEAKKFHDIARKLAVAYDSEADASERAFYANRALGDAERERKALEVQLHAAVDDTDRRALFTFDGKTAITVVWRPIDDVTNTVDFHYDRRILRGI